MMGLQLLINVIYAFKSPLNKNKPLTKSFQNETWYKFRFKYKFIAHVATKILHNSNVVTIKQLWLKNSIYQLHQASSLN